MQLNHFVYHGVKRFFYCVVTAATLMYKYGHVDIRSLQQLLGHESIATTEIYAHVDEGQLQAAVNANPVPMMFS